MVQGIRKDGDTVSPSQEDKKMSLSRLVMTGSVEDTVVNDPNTVGATFRSIKSSEMQDIENQISLIYMGRDDRASRTERHRMLIAQSLLYYYVRDPETSKLIIDYSAAGKDKKEIVAHLNSTSQYVWNELFTLYMLFENRVTNLMKNIDIKKS